MKLIFNSKFIITLTIIAISALLIFFATSLIKLDASLQSLFPHDEKMKRSLGLSSHSPIADKVIVFIEVKNKEDLEEAVDNVDEIIRRSELELKNAIPDMETVKSILEYTEAHSLLLYPYEINKNPFSKNEIQKRINAKADYLMSIPFFNPGKSFFLDPLMMGPEVLKKANENSRGRYSPKYGGVVSENGQTYIKIFRSGFLYEDYDKIGLLKKLDNEIVGSSEESDFDAFVYSGHLYYLESKKTIQREIFIIFILSIVFVLLIFYFFFRRLTLLIFSFMPIVAGFAITFLLIAVFKGKYGGIALAFGASTAGIAIDYTIHYLTKRSLYPTLKVVRKKIGFSLILGFITTIASFIFLPFSNIISLQEIALFGLLTISFAFIFSWFVLQPLLPPDRSKNDLRKMKFPLMGQKGFIIWIILILITSVSLPFLRFEDNIFDLDMSHKKLRSRLEKIQKDFSESSDSIFLAFKGEDKDELLEKSLNAVQYIDDKTVDLPVMTPALFIPPKNRIESRKRYIKENFNIKNFINVIEGSIFSSESFNEWYSAIKNIDNIIFDDLPDFLKEELSGLFIDWDNEQYLLIPLYKRSISKRVNKILTEGKIEHFIVDSLKDSSKGLVLFEKNALFLLLLSIAIIFIILIIAFRNLIFAFTSLLPSISALIGCLGITVITTGAFNIMHLVSSILLLGIGVDYGIFITNSFKDGSSEEELNMTFQSIFISALTTLAGFGVLSFSRNYSIFSIGSSMFIGIVFSFITAYLALPFILKNYKKKYTGSLI